MAIFQVNLAFQWSQKLCK